MKNDPVFPQLRKVTGRELKEIQKNIVKWAALQIWNMICSDIVPEGSSIDRNDVIEIVMDQFEFYTNGKDARAIFKAMTQKERKEALKEAFTSRRYCL